MARVLKFGDAAESAATQVPWFRIAIPAWGWPRSLLGSASRGPDLSREELKSLFSTDLGNLESLPRSRFSDGKRGKDDPSS